MQNEPVPTPTEFEELIRTLLGTNLADLYHRQLEQLSGCIRDLVRYVNDPLISEEMEEVIKENGFQ